MATNIIASDDIFFIFILVIADYCCVLMPKFVEYVPICVPAGILISTVIITLLPEVNISPDVPVRRIGEL